MLRVCTKQIYTLNLPKKYKREILGYQKIPPSEESS